MIPFLLLIMIICIIFKIGQDNVYIGFGLWLTIVLFFVTYTLNSVDKEDIEYERKMLKTREGRKKLYYLINSK